MFSRILMCVDPVAEVQLLNALHVSCWVAWALQAVRIPLQAKVVLQVSGYQKINCVIATQSF